jgi:ribosomal protein S18 acetylase RimI-like enzyme
VSLADRAIADACARWVFFERGLIDAAAALEYRLGPLQQTRVPGVTAPAIYVSDEDAWSREAVAEYGRLCERPPIALFATCQRWGHFDDQQLVGIIAFREGWVDQLYVLPSSQRRGIGTALLAIAQDQFANLRLWTFQRNKAARRFYEKQGFTLAKETDSSANEETHLRGAPMSSAI